MSCVIGNNHGEIKRLNITLLSNANTKIFNNTVTKFTNRTFAPIEKSADLPAVGVRLKKIFVSKYSEINENGQKERHYEPMCIRLGNSEHQLSTMRENALLAQANVRSGWESSKGRYSKYSYLSFDNAPIVKITSFPITYLSIELTTMTGQIYPLWNNEKVVPTIVELEIMSISTTRDFTISCMSHAYNGLIYQNNTLTKFTSNLGEPIDLSSWEVALQSITLPPFLKIKDELIMKFGFGSELPDVNNEANWVTIKIVHVTQYKTKSDIIEKIIDALQTSVKNQIEEEEEEEEKDENEEEEEEEEEVEEGNIIPKPTIKLSISKEETGNHYYISNNIPNTNVYIRLNSPMAAILELTEEITLTPNMSDKTHTSILEGLSYGKINEVIQVPEIVFLYSTVVKANMVGDQLVNLLGVIPMNTFLDSKSPNRGGIMFEPKNLTFHDTIEGSVSALNFVMKRPDGNLFTILPTGKLDYVQNSGGCVITLNFRPKKLNEYSYKVTENLVTLNKKRKGKASQSLRNYKKKFVYHESSSSSEEL